MPAQRRRFAARLGPRDRHEAHRVATPLELFFDLVTVLAVAAAATGLHHSLAQGHPAQGIVGFVCAFFAIWWAWMNYTWFASAYDNGDSLFRLLTLLIMGGALILATGIPNFFGGGRDLALGVAGYVVMRLGMVTLWLRAAAGHPSQRGQARRYALGIALVQVYWTLALLGGLLKGLAFYPAFLVGAVLELSVPLWAERHGMTPWHRHHIVERYGLMNIIVLGETLLAAVMATRAAIDAGALLGEIAVVAIAAVVTAFAMWWLYFTEDEAQLATDRFDRTFVWGYGHVLIFAGGAAAGAGFATQVDVLTEHAHLTGVVADFAVAVPVAVYLFGLWLVRDRYCLSGAARPSLLVGALLALATPLVPNSMAALAILTVACVIVRGELACRSVA